MDRGKDLLSRDKKEGSSGPEGKSCRQVGNNINNPFIFGYLCGLTFPSTRYYTTSLGCCK